MRFKYTLTNDTISHKGVTLYRIQALRSFGDVKKGDIGGYVENHHNLSHESSAWIYDDAMAFEEAYIFNDARIKDEVRVYGKSRVFGDKIIKQDFEIFEDTLISGSVEVFGKSIICNCWVHGKNRMIFNESIEHNYY